MAESSRNIELDNNLGTFDIETYNNENFEAVPYCLSFKCSPNFRVNKSKAVIIMVIKAKIWLNFF